MVNGDQEDDDDQEGNDDQEKNYDQEDSDDQEGDVIMWAGNDDQEDDDDQENNDDQKDKWWPRRRCHNVSGQCRAGGMLSAVASPLASTCLFTWQSHHHHYRQICKL